MGEELEEIKQCQFCGGKAEMHRTYLPWVGGSEGHAWVIGCDGVYGSGCPGYVWKLSPCFLTKEQAIRTWNRRVNNDA